MLRTLTNNPHCNLCWLSLITLGFPNFRHLLNRCNKEDMLPVTTSNNSTFKFSFLFVIISAYWKLTNSFSGRRYFGWVSREKIDNNCHCWPATISFSRNIRKVVNLFIHNNILYYFTRHIKLFLLRWAPKYAVQYQYQIISNEISAVSAKRNWIYIILWLK